MTFSKKSCRPDDVPNLTSKSVELRLRPRRRNNADADADADDQHHHHSNAGKAKEEEGCDSVDDQDTTSRSVALLVNDREALAAAHEVPQPPPCNSLARRGLRYLSLAAILVAWLWLTSLEAKIRAVMVALTFSAIEFHFRAVTRPSAAELNKTIINSTTTIHSESNPDERDLRRAMGLAAVGRRRSTDQLRAVVSTARARLAPSHLRTNGHTTWEQFWANVFYGPIMNDFYRHHLFALALPSFLAWDPLSQALILALFYPLNIWVAEVVMGYYLSRVWRRRAWYYRGRWARLDGNITLAYGPLWHLLGGLYAVGYPLVYAPVPAYLASLLVHM